MAILADSGALTFPLVFDLTFPITGNASSVPADAILDESGNPILDESTDPITDET